MTERPSHAHDAFLPYNTTVLALFAELPDLNGVPCLGTQGLTDQKTYDVNPTGSPNGPIDMEPDLEVDTHPDE